MRSLVQERFSPFKIKPDMHMRRVLSRPQKTVGASLLAKIVREQAHSVSRNFTWLATPPKQVLIAVMKSSKAQFSDH